MNKLLCASMMCADYSNLEKEVSILQEAGIDSFHIDIMDGSYVPNFGMGMQDFAYICHKTKIKVDVHLMIENPSNYVDLFTQQGVSILYFHPESEKHPLRLIDKIKANQVKAGIVINPSSSISSISELLPYIDYILVMSVNPGFAGQKYVGNVDYKIQELVKLKEKYNYQVIVDGAINEDVYQKLANYNVDGFVLGTSLLFGKEKTYHEIIKELRKL